jgi:putative hydroxymethylpyrimidine transport system substrate-binding protein
VISRYRPQLSPLLSALVLAGALGLSACGSSSGARPHPSPSPNRKPPVGSAFTKLSSPMSEARPAARSQPPPLERMTKVTLILDFTPNAVHAGIYRALSAGYYRRENIALQVIQPTSTQETLKLIDAGRAQFGLADGSDVAGLIDKGADAQAVMALVQRPLGGLIARAGEHLRSPADLQGQSVGITGVPSDSAVLDTEVRHAGGNPGKVRVVTVGFSGAQALTAGRIAAFTGFIPDDGVGLQVSGHPITAFALDRYGGPPYPGLVAFSTRRLISADPALVRDFVAATVHGYQETINDPVGSLRDLLAANPTLPSKLTEASLAAYLPLFDDSGHAPLGGFQMRNLTAMSAWMLATHLIHHTIAPARYATNAFLP